MAKLVYTQQIKPQRFPGYEDVVKRNSNAPILTVEVEYDDAYNVTGIQVAGYIDTINKMDWAGVTSDVKEYAQTKVHLLKPFPPDETEDFENEYWSPEVHDREALAMARTGIDNND